MTTKREASDVVLAAVTGTNGKTSVVEFHRQILATAGMRSASLGSLGLTVTGWGRETMPRIGDDESAMPRFVAALGEEGVDALAFEAFSAALASGIHDGLRVDAAGWTNLSYEHLEGHGTLDDYFAAKLRLFTELLSDDGTAVVNFDDPAAAQVLAVCERRGVEVVTYGSDGDIRARATRAGGGLDVDLRIFDSEVSCRVPLFAAFELANALCSLGLALAAGVSPSVAVDAMSRLVPPPGRMVNVGERDGALVVVDYAHNPGGLTAALDALRQETPGRLVLVFGCGGDRDPAKRTLMGEVAARSADVVIVTDDNPRGEDPQQIRAKIIETCPRAREVPDRAEAIQAAVAMARPGDTVLIAGKGDEASIEVEGRHLPHCDVDVARRELEALQRSRGLGAPSRES